MKRLIIIVSLLVFPLLFSSPSQAADDSAATFGSNGQLTTGFSIYDDKANAMAVQSDGKIVVAGESENGADTDIAIARYNRDGSLDPTFNTTGQVTVAVGSANDRCLAVAIQKDGRILAAGTTETDTGLDATVIRLDSAGIPDPTFDHDGQVVIPVTAGDDSAYTILIREDGKIILAGTSTADTGTDLFLVQLNSDGSPDKKFGDAGIARGTKGSATTARSAVLTESGQILLAGSIGEAEHTRAALFAFQSNGQVDTAFAADGVAVSGTEAADSIFLDITLLADDKPAAAGIITGSSYRSILLAVFTADGKADPAFNNGEIIHPDLGSDTIATSLAAAKDGSIYVSGAGSKETDTDFILLRFSSNGHEVSGNSDDVIEEEEEEESASINVKPLLVEDSINSPATAPSYLLTDFNQYNDISNSLIILDDGTILAAGTAGNGKDTDFAVISYSSEMLALARISNGATTLGYYISTTIPTHVTRNSAAAGGYIKNNNASTTARTIETTSPVMPGTTGTVNDTVTTTSFFGTTSYSFTSDSSDITEKNTITPIPTTVTQRGVCYSISPSPVWKNPESDNGWRNPPLDTASTASTTEGDGGLGLSNLFDASEVREGCTSDGTGQGEFRTDLTDLTAGTTYYVRAYAILSDSENTVIYGNELQFTTDDACFIATAAYNSPDQTQVRILRQFRDTYLKPFALGRKFITTYYNTSPPLAKIIENRPALQITVRTLLAPLTAISYLSLHPLSAVTFGSTIFLLLLLLHLITRSKPHTANRIPHTANRKPAGFTLIELLVVLVIIGILAGYVGPRIMGHPDEAKRTMAAAQISSLETALETYKLDNGTYPTTDQGLQALVAAPTSGKVPGKWRKGGYMKKGKVPKDPWGNDYVYLSPGSHSDYDIISYGGDGESGGEDVDADINNWEIE